MSLLPWRNNADLQPLRDDLAALGSRLDNAVVTLERLATAHNSLPDEIVQRAVAEVRDAAQAAAQAVWTSVRRKAIEEIWKWGFRAGLIYAGTHLLVYANQIADGLHK